MAVKYANSFTNASKTYKVDRILPVKEAARSWAITPVSGSLTSDTEAVPNYSYSASGSGSTINLTPKSEKVGEKQYQSVAGEGLAPALNVKLGYKTGKDIYGFSVLHPEKMNNTPDWVQVVISVEELFRASRITKVNTSESGAETYECYGETGHLPIQGWFCVRVPKHIAVSEDMIGAYVADLIGAVTVNGAAASASWTRTLMDLIRGDLTL